LGRFRTSRRDCYGVGGAHAPQAALHAGKAPLASEAQIESQFWLQQNASPAQTQSAHCCTSQPVSGCGAQQVCEPGVVVGSGVGVGLGVGKGVGVGVAATAQTAHASLHAGSDPEASEAQIESQFWLQQNGSAPHTQPAHSWSSQPISGCGTQQLCAFGVVVGTGVGVGVATTMQTWHASLQAASDPDASMAHV
jgi:hypothetical protein